MMEGKMQPVRPISHNVVGPVMEAKSALVPCLLDGAKELLESQGCTVRYVRVTGGRNVVVTYPPGSTRQLLFPAAMEYRYLVCFPNGCELQETEDRSGNTRALYIVKTVFEALREKQLHG